MTDTMQPKLVATKDKQIQVTLTPSLSAPQTSARWLQFTGLPRRQWWGFWLFPMIYGVCCQGGSIQWQLPSKTDECKSHPLKKMGAVIFFKKNQQMKNIKTKTWVGNPSWKTFPGKSVRQTALFSLLYEQAQEPCHGRAWHWKAVSSLWVSPAQARVSRVGVLPLELQQSSGHLPGSHFTISQNEEFWKISAAKQLEGLEIGLKN